MWSVVAARGDRSDHTNRRMPALDRVVAARHQRFVISRGQAPALAGELRLPEVGEVDLVPDVDRGDLREAIEHRGDEAAVVGACGRVAGGSICASEHAQQDLLRPGIRDCGGDRSCVRVARLSFVRLPTLGYPVVAEVEVAPDRRDVRPPLDCVLVDADDETPSRERRRRRQGSEHESEGDNDDGAHGPHLFEVVVDQSYERIDSPGRSA